MDELVLSEYHQQFLLDLKAKGRSNATVIAYGKDIEQFLDLLTKNGRSPLVPSAVTSDDIELFKDGLAKDHYTDKSIYRKINSVKSFFRFLRGIGVISENPANSVSHPKYELS